MALTTNKNFLSPLGFKFQLQRAPNLEYFCQSVNVPALTLGASNLETPFVRLPVPGDRLLFGELNVVFRVDEDLKTYTEIYDWLIALGFPESFDQYTLSTNRAVAGGTDTSIVSDARLTIMTNSMNPNYEINFRDMYPLALSDLQFDTKDTEVDYIEATATFLYRDFKINKIT